MVDVSRVRTNEGASTSTTASTSSSAAVSVVVLLVIILVVAVVVVGSVVVVIVPVGPVSVTTTVTASSTAPGSVRKTVLVLLLNGKEMHDGLEFPFEGFLTLFWKAVFLGELPEAFIVIDAILQVLLSVGVLCNS